MKVLIVPDKFKGTLSSLKAARAMAAGWKRRRPLDKIKILPMSDGGDGFGEVLGTLLGAKKVSFATVDAAHQPHKGYFWWEPKSKTAIIESAAIIGLSLLPAGKFHPYELDTFGLGVAILKAQAKGANRCLFGIGGSATNDGGFGLAQALGWKFLDANKKEIQSWTGLAKLHKILAPTELPKFQELISAVDVQNLLTGSKGASSIYGPQKGLKPQDIPKADALLNRLAKVYKKQFGWDPAGIGGAGAAGGLGFGLMAFLNAKVKSGFEIYSEETGLQEHIQTAELVITGEGRLDQSTLMGKGAGQVALLCRKHKRPCIAMVGNIQTGLKSATLFQHATAMDTLTTPDEAKSKPAHWLKKVSSNLAQRYK